MSCVVVFSTEGREAMTAATVALLDTHGGGSKLATPPTLFWTGDNPPPTIPAGWRVSWPGKRVSPSVDFMTLIRRHAGAFACDLVLLEDDIITCKNALPYMATWEARDRVGFPIITSFFNPNYNSVANRPIGLVDPKLNPQGASTGFEFAQAVKIPSALLQRMCDHEPPRRPPGLDGGDMIINRYLRKWKLPFYQHRSLVEHVGERSTWTPAKLVGARRARDFVGVDFDVGGTADAARTAVDVGNRD